MIPTRSASRLLLRAASCAALVLLPRLAQADIATLKSGKSIEVTSFRLNGDRVELSLPGGGQIAIPAAEVLEIRRQPVQAAVAPEAPAVPAAALRPEGAPAPMPPEVPEGRGLETTVASATTAAAGAATTAAGAATADPAGSPVLAAEELLPGGATDRQSLKQMASRIARRHGVDEPLVHAVIEVESRYNPRAVSRAGAMGLMQLMPKTANRFSVADAFDPVQNVDGGVRYLKELLERYSGQVRLALAAYNAGEEAVERHGGIPPYRETINYVRRVQRAAGR